jgi:hypothetical protein
VFDVCLSKAKGMLVEMSVKSFIKKPIKNIYQRFFGNVDEVLWAQVFHDAIIGSEWLTDKKFYPGRAAVGYEFLYVLFRVLSSTRPKSILELGLGQTTHMISQYVSANLGARHIVVEHDPLWIDFFLKEHRISDRTKIMQMDLGKTDFRGTSVTSYERFSENLAGSRFDFICIDGPFGFDAKKYSRIDTLELMPRCLESSFVIMIDDYNRQAEQNTVKELTALLSRNNIDTYGGSYRGRKTSHLIATSDYKFLCTL